MEAPVELTAAEVKRVVQSMTEDTLKDVVISLKKRLIGSDSDRALSWRNIVRPWLENHWPRQANRNTAQTSRVLLGMLMECGNAFPDAVNWSLEYLRPLAGPGLIELNESEYLKRYPDEMLDVLDQVCVEGNLPEIHRNLLRGILDSVGGAKPTLKGDPRFQKLYGLATK